jgi:hypothetical protein
VPFLARRCRNPVSVGEVTNGLYQETTRLFRFEFSNRIVPNYFEEEPVPVWIFRLETLVLRSLKLPVF